MLEEPGEAPLGFAGPYFRPEGVEHDVVNGSDGPFAFPGIEIRRQG